MPYSLKTDPSNVVDAVKFSPSSLKQVKNLLKDYFQRTWNSTGGLAVTFVACHGVAVAYEGWYIVQDGDGDVWCETPENFEKLYESCISTTKVA